MRRVSIIPRGGALGVTLSTPDDDRVSHTREDLVGKIEVGLGGRVAEEAVYGTITTGAESDIELGAAIARQMVGRWGMSEAIGFVTVIPSETGDAFGSVRETSEATQQLIDAQVRQLIDRAHSHVIELVGQHRDQLEALAAALLKQKTLDEADAYAAARLPSKVPVSVAIAIGAARPEPLHPDSESVSAGANGHGRTRSSEA